MAEVVIPGPLSGRQYGFRIAGEQPTADEQRRIDTLIRQREAQFGQEYQAQFEQPLPGAEGAGLLDYLGEIPKGIGRGVTGLGERAALGAATLLPERFEGPVREGILGASRYLQSGLQPDIGFADNRVAAGIGTLSEGLGSTAPFFALAPFGLAGIAAGAALGGGAGAGEASERARAGDATQDERNLAALGGLGVGLSEVAVPVALRGLFGSLLRSGVPETTIRARLARIGTAATAEGAQEAAAEFLQNAIEQGIYNPEKDMREGLLPAAGTGAGVGAIIQGLIELGTRSRGPSIAPPPAPAPTTPAQGELFDDLPTQTPTLRPGQVQGELFGGAEPVETPAVSEDQLAFDFDTAPAEQGDLFAEPTVVRRAPAPAAPAAPAATAEPATTDFAAIMDELGIPRSAAVRKAVQWGAVKTDEDLRARLAKFAAATTSDRASRVNEYLQRGATPAAESEVEVAPNAVTPELTLPPETVAPDLPIAQETQDAETAPSGPVEPDLARSGDGAPSGIGGVGAGPVTGEPDTAGAESPVVGAVGEPVLGTPEPRVAAGQQPDALTAAAPAAEPIAAPEVEAPAPSVEPAPYTPMTGAIPGAETGAAGQVIPAPITPVAAPPAVPSQTPVQNVVDQIRAQRDTIVEQDAKAAAQAGIETWYAANASPEKQAALRVMDIGAAPSPLSAADMQAVLALLNKAPKQRAKGKITPERAAFVYFSQAPDTDFALRSIAYDHAQVMETDPDAREPDFRRATEFDDPAEAAFYAGTGVEPGTRAAQWVKENLSEQTRQRLAEYTFTEYRPIDYAAESAGRDVRSARQRELQAELDKFISETYTPDALPRASFSMAGIMQWPNRAHPRVEAQLRAGDVRGALQGLAVTAPNKTHRRVAQKLLARIGDVRSQIVSAEVMDRIRATISPETPMLGVETPGGVYVHPLNETQLEAMRREGRNEAADLFEQYGGQMLFNEDVNLSPELVLHEATHVVADGVLANPSHPLTRQLDKLRVELLKFMPATQYGLTNVREMMAEGLNNPMFRRDLSYANIDGQPFSAWQRFKTTVGNWLRGLIGMQPKKPGTAADAVDRALDAIIAMNPNEMGAADIANASFSIGGSKQYLKDAMQRARVPTKADLESTRKVLQNTKIPVSWKGTLLRYAVPLDYVADMASRYFPSARRVHDLIGQHQRAIREGVELVVNTTEKTAKVMTKYARQQPLIDSFNDAAYMATRLQVDPRKPESAYKGYSYQYNVLDKDGNIVRRVESKRYSSDTERNRALQAYNAALPEERKSNRIARARRAFDESPETTADHKRVRDMYLAMPADMQKEFSRMLELQPAVGKGWVDAIRTRIETLLPNDKTLQNRIFGTIYDKILSGRLLDPYLALERSGQFRLSYSAVDPLSISTDPVTGAVDMSNAQVEQFKHSFESEGERQAAIDALMALPPENRVTDITPYEDGRSGFSRQEVPLDFVSRVLDAVDSSGTLAQAVDPQTGATNDVRQQIINLMLDSVPESSFINSFKKRQGIRGFRGDVTLISEPKAAGDVLKNMRESAMRIARKTADLKYGAEFAAVRKTLNDENVALQGTNPGGLSPQELSRQRAEASQYASVLTDYTQAPFNVRSELSRFAGAGTYMLTLGFNVSTALVTMSQIPLFVYPVLAGKYSDARAIGAIGAAHRILTGAGREREVQRVGPDGQTETGTAPVRLWEHSTEYNTSPYLAPLVEYARKNGVFNRSLMQDELLGEQPTMMQKVSAATGIMQHQAERYSRETALNAAYILELQDLMARQDMSVSDFVKGLEAGTLSFSPEIAQAAAEAAVNVSEKSNGPIYAAAGPIASQGNFMSLIYMFKRHPLAMMNLIFSTAARGMGSADPADRKIAQRQAARMFGSLAVFSGALGLPLMQQIGWMYDLLLADDDEPDFKTVVRTTLGEGGAYGLIDYMTGLKISERIGMGSAIYRPGFASQDANPVFQIAEGLGGPVLGMALKYGSGRQLEDLQNGDYQRAAEGLLPTSIANFFKGVRFAQEGIQDRGGNLVDDIGPFHIAAQAFGFMPASYSQQLAMNSLGTKINNAINTKKSKLMQQVHKARDEGDFQRVQELMVEIQEFNAKNPQNRIDGPTLRQSYQSKKRVTEQTSNGLYVSPGNRARVQEVMDAYGPTSILE
jgi:hypothetical protein